MLIQVSALDADFIEVDPETREMLKVLVSLLFNNQLINSGICVTFYYCHFFYLQDFNNIPNLQTVEAKAPNQAQYARR